MFPQKILLENFRSYKNHEVDLGPEGELTLINGLNGAGKSSIAEAIEVCFGKRRGKISQVINRKKDQAVIEVLINNEDNSLPDYPTRFWVKRVLRRDGNHSQYIKLSDDGDWSTVNIEELKNIIDPNDPVLFLDQGTARQWAIEKPKTRWEMLEEVIGLSKLKENLNSVLMEKRKVEKEVLQFEKTLVDVQKQLGDAEIRKNHFEAKCNFEKQRDINKEALLCNEIIQIYNRLIENSRNSSQKELDLEIAKKDLEGIDSRIRLIRSQIKKIEEKDSGVFEELEKKRADLVEVRENREEIYVKYRSDVESRKKAEENNLILPQSSELTIKVETEQNTRTDLEIEKTHLDAEVKRLQDEINHLKSGKVKLDSHILKFQSACEKEKIEFEFIFDILEIKEGMGEWAKAFESALGSSKFAILVRKSEFYKVLQLAKAMNFRGYVLKAEDEGGTYPRIKGTIVAEDIITYNSQLFTKSEIRNALERLLYNNYFIEQIEDCEKLPPRHRYISKDCLMKNQIGGKFIRSPEFIIGRKNREIQLQADEILFEENVSKQDENKIKLSEVQNIQNQLNEQVQKRKDCDYYLSAEFGNLILSLANNVKQLEVNIQSLENEVKHLEDRIKDPLAEQKRLQEKLDVEEHEKSGQSQRISGINEEIDTLRANFQTIISKYRELLQGMEDVDQYFDFSLLNIPDESLFFSQFVITSDIIAEFKANIRQSDTFLEQEHIKIATIDDKKLYDSLLEKYQLMKKQLEEHYAQKETWEKKLQESKLQLEAHQNQWLQSINKNFKNLMERLGMQGKIDITPLGEDQYELWIYAAVKPDEDPEMVHVQKNEVSGGQATQVAMAFTLAIHMEKRRPFMVLDEYDQELDPEKQKILTSLFKEQMPSKLILISPKTYSQAYSTMFDRIIHVRYSKKTGSFTRFITPKQSPDATIVI